MPRVPLADDTSPDIEQRQVEAWQRMSPAEKAHLVTALSHATFELGLAGVRQRFPHASEREVFLRLAIVRFGRDLAVRAYPEIDALGLE